MVMDEVGHLRFSIIKLETAKKRLSTNDYLQEKFNEEISVLRKLKHPNIIRLHDVYKTKELIMVVTGFSVISCEGWKI